MEYVPDTDIFPDVTGEMAGLIRSYDWASTSLGPIGQWSDNLKAKLNTIMHSAFPMFMFWGADLICFYNDAFRPSFGDNGRHPAIGRKGKEVWADAWGTIGPLIRDIMATGKPVWSEDMLVPLYRGGRVEDIYWTLSFSAVLDDNNRIAGVLMVGIETTEKVNLFKQLQESNNLYSFAVDASELGTWDLDPRTNRFMSNSRLKEWFGLAAGDEIDLSSATNNVREGDRQRLIAAIGQALQGASGGTLDIEYTIVHPGTGQERVVRAKGKAAFDEHGQAYRLNGTLQDITAEVIARAQSQKLSILVENSVDLMAILNLEGRNDYINKAGRELLGIDPDADVTRIPIADFHTQEQLAFVRSEILPKVMSAGSWSGEFAARNSRTGEIIPLYNNCHRIDDERTGRPIGIGTVMRDMRAELNTRQELEDEVRKRTKELVKLNEELERKNRDLASFAYVSSHDLQEPLRKIHTFISFIEEDALSARNASYFTRIKRAATRMQTLINDLLAFSNTGTDQRRLERCDLNMVVSDVKKEFSEKLERAGAVLTTGQLPVLEAIPFQLNQLVTNLVSNALKFARPDQPLRIDISSTITAGPAGTDGQAAFHHIVFADNGIGFDPQYSRKIFEVFQRLHSRDIYEGTGIGLSICKRIMENHHGYIRAESEEGAGAVFHLYFPVTGPAADDRPLIATA